MYSAKNFRYGPVFVAKGAHKGRVGDLDNDTDHRGRFCGVVQFGSFGVAQGEYIIPMAYLRAPNTNDILKRYRELWEELSTYGRRPLSGLERTSALEEWAYIADLLNNRMFEAQYAHQHDDAKVFLSHSSEDKDFVRGLAVDLSALGHKPWIDDWEILAGESIPGRIAEGLEETDFAVVVLSDNAVKSKWVESEWQSKYWAELNERRVTVIPVLLSNCVILTLLRTKKYIDFRSDYSLALEQLGRSLSTHFKKRRAKPTESASPRSGGRSRKQKLLRHPHVA